MVKKIAIYLLSVIILGTSLYLGYLYYSSIQDANVSTNLEKVDTKTSQYNQIDIKDHFSNEIANELTIGQNTRSYDTAGMKAYLQLLLNVDNAFIKLISAEDYRIEIEKTSALISHSALPPFVHNVIHTLQDDVNLCSYKDALYPSNSYIQWLISKLIFIEFLPLEQDKCKQNIENLAKLKHELHSIEFLEVYLGSYK